MRKVGQDLYDAAKNGDLKKAKEAIENGANVNVKNKYGETPLHWASWKEHEAVVSLLLENGADVNAKDKNGQTPLHYASDKGHEAVVSLLLEKGADPTITDNNGKTPLQLAQENNNHNCVAAIEQFQRRFYRHLDEISVLVQAKQENSFISLVPTFEKALEEMSDFLQLKYYFTAVNAQYRLGTITSEDRKMLILPSLQRAKDWCVSPFHVAMYRVALRYALSEKIIDQLQWDHLDVAAVECDIANTAYIQAMQTMICQNAARIQYLGNSLAFYQNTVAKSISNLQQNLIAVNENVVSLHGHMDHMATAINDTQSTLKQFKATLAYKRKVEAGCSLLSAILNAVSLGAAGSALQGVLGFTLARVADFGDLAHLSGVFAGVSLPNELSQEIGNISVHDMIEHGVSLVENHADDKLDDVLGNENAIVVMAASAAVFTSTLDLDNVDELVAKTAVALNLNEASSHSPSESLEKKLARLTDKRKRRESTAELAQKLGQDVCPIFQEILQIEKEIDQVKEQIDNN